jgi:hypothetical protein
MLLLSGAMPSDLSGGRPNLLLRGVHTLGNELIVGRAARRRFILISPAIDSFAGKPRWIIVAN